MISIFRWLIRSRDNRFSRLHSANNVLINARSPLINISKSLITYALNLININFNIPWISWDACADIKRYIKNKKTEVKVLEFGSGRSTIWFLKNGCTVTSIEHSSDWFEIVYSKIKSSKFKKIKYIHAKSDDEYVSPNITGQFDIILIDGRCRSKSFINSIKYIKPGGLVYIDNTDADSSDGKQGEIKELCNYVKKYAIDNNATIKIYVDFSPSSLFATEGMLIIHEKSS
jgi:precorrin-6B methylase 2